MLYGPLPYDEDTYYELLREQEDERRPAETVFTTQCPAGHSYRTSVMIDGICDACESEAYNEMMQEEYDEAVARGEINPEEPIIDHTGHERDCACDDCLAPF